LVSTQKDETNHPLQKMTTLPTLLAQFDEAICNALAVPSSRRKPLRRPTITVATSVVVKLSL